MPFPTAPNDHFTLESERRVAAALIAAGQGHTLDADICARLGIAQLAAPAVSAELTEQVVVEAEAEVQAQPEPEGPVEATPEAPVEGAAQAQVEVGGAPVTLALDEAKQCPWCGRWALKNAACQYIFACGEDEAGVFHPDQGCGRPWCFTCGGRFCGRRWDPATGERDPMSRDAHDDTCCRADPEFSTQGFCPGGHNSHCAPRWFN